MRSQALGERERRAWAHRNSAKISELAEITDDERRYELKNAYVLAYVTLGAKWMLTRKLNEVRELLQDSSPLPDVCATFSKSLPERKVHIIAGQIDCVAVSIAPHHGISATVPKDSHVVLLPHGNSPEPFYNAWTNRQRNAGVDLDATFDWPPPQTLANEFDRCTVNDCAAHPGMDSAD